MSRSEADLMRERVSRLVRPRWRSPDVKDLLASLRDRLVGTEERRARTRKRLLVFGPPAILILGLVGWWLFGPVMQPDYQKGNLRKVFNYTLLTDEFNKLPVEERLRLIGVLVERMKSMNSGDSALMAAFAAGIAGAAREQLEKNASRLAIDVWDMYAARYADVPADERGAYLDNTAVEFMKMLETVAGETRDISDTERLAEMRRQAQRDKEQLSQGQGPPPRAMGRLFAFMDGDMGGHASPSQRARGAQMMRDMIRHLRGQGPR